MPRRKRKKTNVFDTRILMDEPTIERLDEYIEQRYQTTEASRGRAICDIIRDCLDIAEDKTVQECLDNDLLYGRDVMVFIRKAVSTFIQIEVVEEGV